MNKNEKIVFLVEFQPPSDTNIYNCCIHHHYNSHFEAINTLQNDVKIQVFRLKTLKNTFYYSTVHN